MAETILTPEMLELAKRAADSKSVIHHFGRMRDYVKKKRVRRKMVHESRKLMRHVNGRSRKR